MGGFIRVIPFLHLTPACDPHAKDAVEHFWQVLGDDLADPA